MSEYGAVRQQIFELMTKAGRLIESLPTEGQRHRMHATATDDLIDARNAADVFHGGALFHAFVEAVTQGEEFSRCVPPLVPALRLVEPLTEHDFDELVKEGA